MEETLRTRFLHGDITLATIELTDGSYETTMKRDGYGSATIATSVNEIVAGFAHAVFSSMNRQELVKVFYDSFKNDAIENL